MLATETTIAYERALIHAAITRPNLAADLAEAVPSPDMFYRTGHQALWRAFLTLCRAGKRIGAAEVAEAVRLAGEWESAGDGLGEIVRDVTARTSDWQTAASTVVDHWRLRELARIGHQMVSNASATDADADELQAWMQSQLADLTAYRATPIPTGLEIAKILDAEVEAAVTTGAVAGWRTGHDVLDHRILGWLPGSLHLLCGRSGDGKTYLAWALCHAFQTANPRLSAGIVSLEMQPHELASRQVIGDKFFRDAITMPQNELDYRASVIRDRIQDYAARPIRVAQPMPIRMDVIERTIRGMAREGCKLVVLDYIQMVPIGASKREDPAEAVQRQMQALKNTAVECGIVILILSQMNRGTYDKSLMDFGLENSFGHQGAQATNAAHTVSCPIRVSAHRESDPKVKAWVTAMIGAGVGDDTINSIVIHRFAKGRRGVSHHCVFWQQDKDNNLVELTGKDRDTAGMALREAMRSGSKSNAKRSD